MGTEGRIGREKERKRGRKGERKVVEKEEGVHRGKG